MTLSQLRKLLFHRFAAPSSAAILLFHRIAEVDDDTFGPDPQLSVSPAEFERVVSQLASDFHPVALPELISWMRNGSSLPPNIVVLTFDDGFRDTLTTALPVLEMYAVPATVYVTTGFVDGSVLPYEYVLARHIEQHQTLYLSWEGRRYDWALKSSEDRERCYREVKAIGKPLLPNMREKLLNQLKPSPSFTVLNEQYMTPREVARLAQSPLITIGGHTHSHPMLSAIDQKAAREDVQYGHEMLEGMIEERVQYFSYPYGAYSAPVRDMIRNMGFISSVTTRSAIIESVSAELMSLPRIEVKGTDILKTLRWQF